MIQGTPVVAGKAYAPVMWASRLELPHTFVPVPESERVAQREAYEDAAHKVSDRLSERAMRTVGTAGDVLFTMSAFATDKGIRREVASLIDSGASAVEAIIRATAIFSDRFKLAGGFMAERASDLGDVRNRIVAELLGQPEPGIPTPVEPIVLLAEDLSPADAAGLNPDLVMGIATTLGGPTSHTAIIARQLGIPCVVAVSDLASVAEGEYLFFDGTTGRLSTGVDSERAEQQVLQDHRWRERAKNWNGPAITTDGRHIELLVNVQDGAGAKAAAAGPAEGVGLLRTELCFLEEMSEPSIEHQELIYSKVFGAFPTGKVVVRTLDAGSDKPISYATVGDEDNPALGVRGLRIRERHPDIMSHQLEAISRAARSHPKAWVMAPMVSTVEEAEWFTDAVHAYGLRAGIMVEVPAVALQARRFLEIVDFVSIGTNDLTQYVMAADRLSPYLAQLTDAWQPAVLDLIATTARAGRYFNKPVGVCGEAAADPLLACVLTGMGISSLSMAPSQVPMVGAQLSAVTYASCVRAAEAVRSAHDAMDARRLARESLGM